MSIEWMISSSGLMVSVLLVRVLFKKKIPPCLGYALWLVVAFRLLLPISISGTFCRGRTAYGAETAITPGRSSMSRMTV